MGCQWSRHSEQRSCYPSLAGLALECSLLIIAYMLCSQDVSISNVCFSVKVGNFLGHVAPALAAATEEHCVSPLNFFVFLRSETLSSVLSPKYPTLGTAAVGARTAKCPENTL